MNGINNLLHTLKELIENTISSKSFSKVITAKLISLEPLVFSYLNGKIKMKGNNLITPAHRVFTNEDINKNFCFLENEGGQEYFYLYKMAEKGKNGTLYEYEVETKQAAKPNHIRKKERLLL